MSFLSLARGDIAAISLLKQAVVARYGPRPVVIESARVMLENRVKGPLGLPAKILTTFSYVGTTHWRWEQTRKAVGIAMGVSIASFDGGACYSKMNGALTQNADADTVRHMRSRLWAELAMFLSPLTQSGVIVTTADGRAFKASPEGDQNILATVNLNEDDSVKMVQAECYDPEHKRTAILTLRPQNGLQNVDEVIFPRQIAYQWGDGEAEVYDVIKVEANPKIPLTDFTMS